jgi:hypothetical protein
MVEKSEALEKIYYQYTHLPLGGKKIRCSYWSNKQRILLSGPFKGKGTPSQITRATARSAQEHKIDLSKLSPRDIRRFMEHHRIGVDCSGFVYHLADSLDKEKGGRGISDYVEGVRGKGVMRVNAFCLTNDKNSEEVKKIRDIRIGDFIQIEGGKHIAIILRIKRNQEGIPIEVTYAHSGRLSAITGVHLGRFLVKNPNLGVKDQKFLEKSRKGYNYFTPSSPKDCLNLRRLKIWAK